MNELAIIVLLAIGILLIYAAVKDEKPQDIVKSVFGGRNA